TFYEGRVTTATGTLFLGIGGSVTATGFLPAPFEGARIDGRFSLASGTHTFNMLSGGSSQALTIGATVLGTGGITKTGSGDMDLLVSNSYGGLTVIQQGTMSIANSFGLGSTNQGTIVENGGSLWLSAANLVVNEGLTLNGTGAPSNGALNVANPYNGCVWAAPI